MCKREKEGEGFDPTITGIVEWRLESVLRGKGGASQFLKRNRVSVESQMRARNSMIYRNDRYMRTEGKTK